MQQIQQEHLLGMPVIASEFVHVINADGLVWKRIIMRYVRFAETMIYQIFFPCYALGGLLRETQRQLKLLN